MEYTRTQAMRKFESYIESKYSDREFDDFEIEEKADLQSLPNGCWDCEFEGRLYLLEDDGDWSEQ